MAGQKKSPKPKRKPKTPSSKAIKKEETKRKLAEAQEEENEAEFQKAVLEIRVKELETLNTGMKGKCDYLESQNNVYKTQLEESREERNELVNYLEKCLREEQTISKELEDRLYGMQEARREDIRDFNQKFSEKEQEFEAMKTNLDKTILELGVKLASIEEFRVQKVELTNQMQNLQEVLAEERKQFAQKFDELEKKTILYRQKIKQDAIETLTKLAEDVQQAGKMSLTSTVKAAIAANVKLNQELETVSKDNLSLRDSLDNLTTKLRENRLTIQILEEQNSIVHKKCLQYKEILKILLDKQVQMDAEIKLVKKLEIELKEIKDEHALCPSEEEIQAIIKNEIDEQRRSELQTGQVESFVAVEAKQLREVVIKMAIVAKDLSEAMNEDEFKFLKGRFKTMLIKLYESACDIQDLPHELKSRLVIQLPQISTLKHFP